MSITKVGPKHQITIPKEIFRRLNLAVGDYLDVQVRGSTITIAPAKFIPRDDQWFHSPEWQTKEREADAAIARGDVSGPFSSAEQVIRHLRKRTARKNRNPSAA